ncbi:hypothetical protein DFQ26_000761 [Actinomortierella ambigua]|nr:hypothetical protein DFQ26_000761 [Actinomortierella ambigua]
MRMGLPISLEEAIGSGASGVVYKGRWGISTVAIKKFYLNRHECRQQPIQAELQRMRTLRGQCIIQYYGEAYHEDMLVIIMEYAAGGSLMEAIERGGLDWHNKTKIAREIACGLEFMHERDILHRELKSTNVLLTKYMEVKLGDFGHSVINTVSAASKGVRGTLRWHAPELLLEKPVYSTKSDVYALGVVMWEMAANCTRPYKDYFNEVTVAALILSGKRESIPGDTPNEYSMWVARCWSQDPLKRPDAGDVLPQAEDRGTRRDNDDVDVI